MAKEATLQVRMDAELKDKVRIFARQSVRENGMPFVVTANRDSTYGRLSEYADAKLVAEEEGAYEKAMVEKYEKAD